MRHSLSRYFRVQSEACLSLAGCVLDSGRTDSATNLGTLSRYGPRFGERLSQLGGRGRFGAVVDAWQQLDVAVELFYVSEKRANCDSGGFLDDGTDVVSFYLGGIHRKHG